MRVESLINPVSGLNPWLGQHKIGIYSSTYKHTALRIKSKDLWTQNQYNMFKWSDMSTCGMLFLVLLKFLKSMLV